MSVSDGRRDKSFEEKLRNPSILDQLSIPYIKGPLVTPPGPQPGRFRNIAFFDNASPGLETPSPGLETLPCRMRGNGSPASDNADAWSSCCSRAGRR
jgi:hypothetical protein